MLELLSPSAQAALIQLIDERVADRMRVETSTPVSRSPWLTVREAADYLRTTPAAIYKRISRRQLVAYRPEGSRIMLHRDELDASGPSNVEVL